MSSEDEVRCRASPDSWISKVVEYYNHTRFDYWFLWHDRNNLAFHFGYYEDGIDNHSRALENGNHVLANIAGIGAGQRVLDAGCGLGGSSLWLAGNCGAHSVGITTVEHQVRRARAIAGRRSLSDKARFVQADYTAMPFTDGSFDVVWAFESLCHAAEKTVFDREAARVLRPGGRLGVAEYVRASRSCDSTAQMLFGEWLEGWAIPDLYTSDEHLAAAGNAGFHDAELRDYTWSTRRSLRRLYKLACIATPIDWTLYLLGLRSRRQHGNVVAALRQYQALKCGLWFYGILTASKPC
jgi:cyclopropane fatty-acyl-phospholipid synthase-like methyltransferase